VFKGEKVISKKWKLAALAWLLVVAGHAAEVVAVLSGNSGPYKEALEGLKAVVGDVSAVTLPEEPDLNGAKVVVTFGSEAALRSYHGLPMVAALLPDPKVKLKHGGGLTRVGLAPAPGVLLAKVRALQSDANTLAALDPSGSYSEYLALLKTAGMNVIVKKVDSEADLATKLPALKGAAQALWVPPDPMFMNPKTFGLIAQFCRNIGVGMYAPVAGLAKAGALAGLAPSFKAQGRAAGVAAQSYVAGAAPGEWVYSDKTDFIANKAVAHALGIGDAALAKADSTVE
jgi:hypothetical protein